MPGASTLSRPEPRATYATVLRARGVLPFTLAGFVGRMPISMFGLGTLLLVRDERHSYALAGALSAVAAIGLAVGGPFSSRLIDRYGQRPVLLISVALHLVGVVVTLLLAPAGVPAVVLAVPVALAGLTFPQIGSSVRARWAAHLTARGRPAELQVALAWESLVDEVVFVLGPLVVVAVATTADPRWGLVAALALCVVGTLALVAQTGTEPAVVASADRQRGSALRSPGLRVVAVVALALGTVFGGLDVATVAVTQAAGHPGAAGPLLALVALGSGVAALAIGGRGGSPARRLAWALVLLAVVSAVLPVLPSITALAIAAPVLGLAVSPSIISSYALAEAHVPATQRTEGFSWLVSGLDLGVAAGSWTAGLAVAALGPHAGYLACVGGVVLALAARGAGRRALRLPGPSAEGCTQHPGTGGGPPDTARSG